MVVLVIADKHERPIFRTRELPMIVVGCWSSRFLGTTRKANEPIESVASKSFVSSTSPFATHKPRRRWSPASHARCHVLQTARAATSVKRGGRARAGQVDIEEDRLACPLWCGLAGREVRVDDCLGHELAAHDSESRRSASSCESWHGLFRGARRRATQNSWRRLKLLTRRTKHLQLKQTNPRALRRPRRRRCRAAAICRR